MSREKVVIFVSPVFAPDEVEEKPICAIERDGKTFTMYSIDKDTADKFTSRIRRSGAVDEVDDLVEDEDGNTYSVLAKIVGQTLGLLVGSTVNNDVTDASFNEAKNDLNVRTTFKVK